MKKPFSLFSVLFLLILSLPVFSQNFDFRVRFFATDALGRMDTVELGFDPDFTNGLDAQLGEINLFGQPADTLEIRILQRDPANWNNLCSGGGDSIYFLENFDSRLNVRKDLYSFSGIDYFYFGNFELMVFAKDLPVTITADLSELPDYFSGYSSIKTMGTGCIALNENPLYPFLGSQPLAVVNGDSTTLHVYLQHEVGVKDPFANSRFRIAPNPVSSDFELQGLEADGLVDYEILNGLSKTVLKGTSTGTFRMETLSSGMYYLKINQNGYSTHLPFIKE